MVTLVTVSDEIEEDETMIKAGSLFSSESDLTEVYVFCVTSLKDLDSNPSQSCLILAYFQSSVSQCASRQGWSDLFTPRQLKVSKKQKIACS